MFPRIFLVVTFFGVMNLLHMVSSPAWANIRGVDVVRLIGTGMCFGVAIVSLVAYFRDRNSSWRIGILHSCAFPIFVHWQVFPTQSPNPNVNFMGSLDASANLPRLYWGVIERKRNHTHPGICRYGFTFSINTKLYQGCVYLSVGRNCIHQFINFNVRYFEPSKKTILLSQSK